MRLDEYLALAAKEKKPKSKYRAKKATVDGVSFHSKGEAERWCTLRMLEQAGVIEELYRQRTFRLEVNGIHICDYKADFVYFEDGERVVEDYKGVMTKDCAIKIKLMKACHNIDVRITK